MSQPYNSVYKQVEQRDEYAHEKLRMMELRKMGMNQKHHEAIRLIMAALEVLSEAAQVAPRVQELHHEHHQGPGVRNSLDDVVQP